jgi:hypothetical protein
MGPNVVAAWDQLSDITSESCTAKGGPHTMKRAILRPRLLGSCQTSAQIPPTTLIAQLPPMPTRSLKMRRAAKFGATAEAMEKMLRIAKEMITIHLRPYCSDSGPQTIGPKVYPTRNRDVGRMSLYSLYS